MKEKIYVYIFFVKCVMFLQQPLIKYKQTPFILSHFGYGLTLD